MLRVGVPKGTMARVGSGSQAAAAAAAHGAVAAAAQDAVGRGRGHALRLLLLPRVMQQQQPQGLLRVGSNQVDPQDPALEPFLFPRNRPPPTHKGP